MEECPVGVHGLCRRPGRHQIAQQTTDRAIEQKRIAVERAHARLLERCAQLDEPLLADRLYHGAPR